MEAPAGVETLVPVPAVQVDPPAPPVVHGATLRVAAFREGRIQLSARGGTLVMWLDGEPWSWGPTGPSRTPSAGLGLPPIDDRYVDTVTTYAVGGIAETLPTWQTWAWDFPRMGSSYTVHHREGDRWSSLDLRQGRLVAYYADYVEREGALLALQAWAPEPEALHYVDDPGAEPAELDDEPLPDPIAPPLAWIQLEGPPVALPAPPPILPSTPIVATGDGTLYAAIETRSGNNQLLRWPAGSTAYERVKVPDLRAAEALVLSFGGEEVVLGGYHRRGDRAKPYLVVGRGDEWTRVATPSWKPVDPDFVGERVLAAVRAPNGELWVALGLQYGEASMPPFWRRSPEGTWQSFPIPPFPVVETSGPAQNWVYAPDVVRRNDEDVHGRLVHRWEALETPSYDEVFSVGSMVWASGALWITVLQEDSTYGHFTRDRTMLLTTHVGEDAPVLLPPAWQLQLEHRNEALRTAVLGSPKCRTFSLVLGPASLATTQPELVPALRSLRRPRRTKLGPIYTGSLDGTAVLVAHAEAPTREAGHALRDAVAAAVGLEVRTDCRKPLMDMVVSPTRAK